MRMYLMRLNLFFRKEKVSIEFSRLNYFWGMMGTGKSSIGRLIDFCLGGDSELTPALQSEFVSASLTVWLEAKELIINRERGAQQVRAQWTEGEQGFDFILPARDKRGEVIPGTGVETLSDLLFALANMEAPKVRRSRVNDESDLERITIRDLLWYCYLSQESMDSSFFYLEPSADKFKRLKSRNVIRYIVGFLDENLAGFESQLEEVRLERNSLLQAAGALKDALQSLGVSSAQEISSEVLMLRNELEAVNREVVSIRASELGSIKHAADSLRQAARNYASEIHALENALVEVERIINDNRKQLNEVVMLNIKFRRDSTAKAVLRSVEFSSCPRCTQPLPTRREHECHLCGQPEDYVAATELDLQVQADVDQRRRELEEIIRKREDQRRELQYRRNDYTAKRQLVDTELSEVMRDYDSAFLSSVLALEHKRADIERQIVDFERLRQLPLKMEEQFLQAESLLGVEAGLRRQIKEAKERAEKDTSKLRRLEELFHDCLLRSKIDGITEQDVVNIPKDTFYPEVYDSVHGNQITTSFLNVGSGGKTTLFKCCFSLALHRLAAEINAPLPRFLIIDTPMKNISDRVNRLQVESFHKLVFELAAGELKDLEFILIENDDHVPTEIGELKVNKRYLSLDDPTHPPLIPYYRGH